MSGTRTVYGNAIVGVPAQTRVFAGTTVVPVLAANERRLSFWVANDGLQKAYLAFGRDATVMDFPVIPGAPPVKIENYAGAVTAISVLTGADLRIIEMTW